MDGFSNILEYKMNLYRLLLINIEIEIMDIFLFKNIFK